MGVVTREELEDLAAAEAAAKDQNNDDDDPSPAPQPAAPPQDNTAELRAQIAALNARIEALQAQPPAQPAPAPQPPAPTFTEDDLGAGADPASFERKINETLDRIVTNKTQPLANASAHTQALLAMQLAESQLPYFKQFKAQIMGAAQNMTPQQLADPRTWMFLHNTIVGANVENLVTNEVQRRTTAPPTTETGDDQPPGGGGKIQLSPDEQRMAKLLGADLEDARLMKEFLNG